MDFSLAVVSITNNKVKQSLSCGDIASLTSTDQLDTRSKQRKYSKQVEHGSLCNTLRFLKPSLRLQTTNTLDRTKSRSLGSEIIDNIERRLSEIKETLAMFREQDVELRQRMDSLGNTLGNTIDDLASLKSGGSSSLTGFSETSSISDDQQIQYEDDQNIENEINNISRSFSTEVLNSIPTIAVISHKRKQSSDPALHESARLSENTLLSVQQQQRAHSTACIPDIHIYHS